MVMLKRLQAQAQVQVQVQVILLVFVAGLVLVHVQYVPNFHVESYQYCSIPLSGSSCIDRIRMISLSGQQQQPQQQQKHTTTIPLNSYTSSTFSSIGLRTASISSRSSSRRKSTLKMSTPGLVESSTTAAVSFSLVLSSLFSYIDPITTPLATSIAVALVDDTLADVDVPMLLSNETIWLVFIIGLLPFAIATYEFWRRIAVSEPFGTTSDSIIFSTSTNNIKTNNNTIQKTQTTIGEDNNPSSSRGQQILDPSALVLAYVLFAIAFSTIALAIYSVLSTSTTTLPLTTT